MIVGVDWTAAVGAWLLDNWIALAALVLSLWLALAKYLTGRRANLAIRMGKSPDGSGSADLLILTNHGPNEARRVDATFKRIDGEEWSGFNDKAHAFPIPVLAPGDEYVLSAYVVIGTGPYVTSHLSWKDGRLRRQKRNSTLSTTGLPIGMSSHAMTSRMAARLGELSV